MNRRHFLSASLTLGACALLSRFPGAAAPAQSANRSRDAQANPNSKGIKKIMKTDAEWKELLTPEQYNVMRQKGTEAPYSSSLNDIHEKGIFECAACELPLFSSSTKFDSGTGWPSFWAPIKKENVREQTDNSLSMTRTEVLCARCDAHSGSTFLLFRRSILFVMPVAIVGCFSRSCSAPSHAIKAEVPRFLTRARRKGRLRWRGSRWFLLARRRHAIHPKAMKNPPPNGGRILPRITCITFPA